MSRADGVRALAREAGRHVSTAGKRWVGAVGEPVRDRAGAVGDAVRTTATRTTGAVRDARDRAVHRGAATRAGRGVGDVTGRVGRWARDMPVLSLPRAVVDQRHGIARLSALVGEDPLDPVRAVQLAESLARLDRDLDIYLAARVALTWNPLLPVVAEAAKVAGALGTGELTSPAESMQRRAYALAVRRLRADRDDGVALHVVARVFAARDLPGPGLRPAHRAVARTSGAERGRALYTAARLHRMAGEDGPAGEVAAQAVRHGCSLGWLVLADLRFATDAGGTAAERIAGYRSLRERVSVEDETGYRGVVRPPASDLWRAVLRDQTGKAAAGYRASAPPGDGRATAWTPGGGRTGPGPAGARTSRLPRRRRRRDPDPVDLDPADAEPLIAAADVPVAGGVVLPGRGVVVTQPIEGEFRVFDAVCPHRGCTVRSVVAGTINCLCHGSRFRVTDGSVAGGPSPAPLVERDAVVDGGMVVLRGPGGLPDPP